MKRTLNERITAQAEKALRILKRMQKTLSVARDDPKNQDRLHEMYLLSSSLRFASSWIVSGVNRNGFGRVEAQL